MKDQKDSVYPEEWLQSAKEDWEVAEILLNAGKSLKAIFHLQQSLEKYFKAYLLKNGWKLQRTHSLPDLLSESLKYNKNLARYRNLCEHIFELYLLS